MKLKRLTCASVEWKHQSLQSIYYVCDDVLRICMEIIELIDFGNTAESDWWDWDGT